MVVVVYCVGGVLENEEGKSFRVQSSGLMYPLWSSLLGD